MTINMWIASFAWACLVAAFFQRRNRGVHVALALTGIGLDLTLVLYLQFTRSAVQTALEFSLSPLQQIHIGFSLVAVLLYIPTVVLGLILLRGTANRERLRPIHYTVAIGALVSRTAGFFFMFSMWK